MPSFNCSCDEGFYGNETLSELRISLLERLGYAAQVANPPPGMNGLLNNFLRRSQSFLYRRYRALQTERFYSWVMIPGERFYGVLENDERLYGGNFDNGEECARRLDTGKLSWVGVEDLNGVWSPLTAGIPPECYTSVDFSGLPARYEVRQCIEVFPAPAEAYTLRVKGHFGLSRFTEDDDQCTIDSELLFMWALANAKNHYGQPDAQDIATQAQTYLRDLIADSHGTRRYVPGTSSAPMRSRPVFLDLEG